ncbi:MAG: U32 family peptidase C-terminal domain-containing protein [Candidatus Omnitrophica bacterium]|nr:U32 family peptidase C-terminal domain-containing protein [Candidatus Omnitrophota bacterium]
MAKTTELVIPAGDLEKLKYAIAFGADAVYLGIPKYSLRARENGFKSLADVALAIDYTHKSDKKAYVTANVFAHNSKVSGFVKYVDDLLRLCKPDAWILSDPGLISLMREHFPKEAIHISVQSNVINYASAKFWQTMGAKRIILSREITIAEMKEIHAAAPDLELESFVHGAICIAYSGRCLISNYLTHRDSNQGLCTNSCRWQYKLLKKDAAATETPYADKYIPLKDEFALEEAERKGELLPLDEDENGTYLMNAKDLCAIECLNELKAAGISAFKVEGRSKTVYYVSMITRAYRRAINDMKLGKPFNPEHMKDILATSARGYTQGFLHGNPQESALEYNKSGSASSTYRFTGIVTGYDNDKKLMKVDVRNPIKINHSYELCLPDQDIILDVKEIFNDKAQPVNEIHGGLHSCWLPYPQNPGDFALFREKIDA